MFFHIPLYVDSLYLLILTAECLCRPEAYSKPDIHPQTGKPLDIGITGREHHGNAKKSDGFFDKGVLGARESEHVASGNAPEVKVIGNGHCHCESIVDVFLLQKLLSFLPVTENCRRVKGVWNCFGGGG